MAKPKYDGVIEAVHYNPDGLVNWVRAYERRGPTFSDHVLLKRQALVDRLKSGQKFMAGKRVPLEASTFEVSHPLRVIQVGGADVIVAGVDRAEHDQLEGVPII